MSSLYYKTTYQEEDGRGNLDTLTLYARHHNTIDVITFYDHNFNPVFSVCDCVPNNMFDAIKRLYEASYTLGNDGKEITNDPKLEFMTYREILKINP